MMRRLLLPLLPLLCLATLAPAGPAARTVPREPVYEQDVAFALDELERQCGALLRLKGVDWKKVRREFEQEAKRVGSDGEHVVLMQRLVARLRDGHARLEPVEEGGVLPWPAKWREERVGPGFGLCRAGKKLFVKRAWASAVEVGIEPGMEVLKIDEEPAMKWLEGRIAELSDRSGFSTEQHAFASACQSGLAQPPGTRLKLELRDAERKTKKRTLTYDKASLFNEGPAVVLEGLTWAGKSLRYGRTPEGTGYIHVRRIEDSILAELDEALAALADVSGLILDFRGNSGGGGDHDALEARFVPAGHSLQRMARGPLPSAGPHPYGGPMVVIVDGLVVSAGETVAGMFKEDGRAYMIGESATAGMSSQKTRILLPSGKLALYVSTHSNRSSFNGGRGIEGIGVAPQELVEYDPKDLSKGVDTLIRRAEELLAKFPRSKVRYDPADYGWAPAPAK